MVSLMIKNLQQCRFDDGLGSNVLYVCIFKMLPHFLRFSLIFMNMQIR